MLDSIALLLEPMIVTCADLLRGAFSNRTALPEAQLKSDNSPVTVADQQASDLIVGHLNATYPDIPVISEEAAMPSIEQRLHWDRLFLVDPLDGTKEFIRGSPDFTINIAYIERGVPLWGIICAPIHRITVYGGRGLGAFSKQDSESNWKPLNHEVPSMAQGLRAVMSQGHTSPWESPIAKLLPLNKIERFGSSYKFARLAMGQADIYFRKTPTYEWDTAAGHAILAALGFSLQNFKGEEFSYNLRDTLLNGEFLCAHKSLMEVCLLKLKEAGLGGSS
jgi:3'(2'), 5'-bisphosphate nucleotidase